MWVVAFFGSMADITFSRESLEVRSFVNIPRILRGLRLLFPLQKLMESSLLQAISTSVKILVGSRTDSNLVAFVCLVSHSARRIDDCATMTELNVSQSYHSPT